VFGLRLRRRCGCGSGVGGRGLELGEGRDGMVMGDRGGEDVG